MVRTLEEWNLQLRTLGEQGDGSLIGVVKKELTRIGANAARDAKRNATTAPKVRTGALRNSIRSRVTVSGSEVQMALGASVVYARIQEYGGTILFRSRAGSITLKPNRYLGKAMDTATADAKVSVMAAVKAALRGERG